MVYWKSCPAGVGGWPSRPAATWRFCSLMALMASPGGHLPRRQLLGVQPDAHAVVARAEEDHVADALDAGQGVLDLDGRVVAQVQLVVLEPLLAGLRVGLLHRDEVDAQQDAGRLLLGRHPLPAHLLGQLGLGDRHPVLHQHLGHVEVGPQREGDVEVHLAVVGTLRRHVQHVLHAVDLLLDRRGHGVGDDLGVGPGIDGRDLDGRGHDLRVLGDRQLDEQEQAQDHSRHGQHGGADRAVDEEA